MSKRIIYISIHDSRPYAYLLPPGAEVAKGDEVTVQCREWERHGVAVSDPVEVTDNFYDALTASEGLQGLKWVTGVVTHIPVEVRFKPLQRATKRVSIAKVVEDILIAEPETREDDRLLIRSVYIHLGVTEKDSFIRAMSNKNLPSVETIILARRKLMRDNPDLKRHRKRTDRNFRI